MYEKILTFIIYPENDAPRPRPRRRTNTNKPQPGPMTTTVTHDLIPMVPVTQSETTPEQN